MSWLKDLGNDTTTAVSNWLEREFPDKDQRADKAKEMYGDEAYNKAQQIANTKKKKSTVATTGVQPSSDDWGEPYVDPRKNWEKASDEDFFKIANLPAGFYGRLRDPEFRADVEKYEKAVRDGDLSPTGERARLMKKHPVLKMMTQKDTSITGNEIDTYIDPKFLKAVRVANRNEKLIPTGKTTTPSQGVVAAPDADNIAPKADGEERIKPPEVLQNPEEFDQSEIDTEVEPDSDERQIGGAGKYEPERTDYLDTGSTDTAMSGGGVGNLDYSNIITPNRSTYSGLMTPTGKTMDQARMDAEEKRKLAKVTSKTTATEPEIKTMDQAKMDAEEKRKLAKVTGKNIASTSSSNLPNAALKVKSGSKPKPDSDDGVYRNQSFSQSFKDAKRKTRRRRWNISMAES